MNSGTIQYEDCACWLNSLCVPFLAVGTCCLGHLTGEKSKARGLLANSKRGELELRLGLPDVRGPFPMILTVIQSW